MRRPAAGKTSPSTKEHGLRHLFDAQPTKAVETHAAIFLQDAPATHLFLVVRGRIRLVRQAVTGQTATLHVAEAGELFAEGALFSDVYRCDAIADQASEIRCVSKPELLRYLQDSPSLALELLERVTRQLHQARLLIELRNIRSAEARVMQHLRLLLPANSDELTLARPLNKIANELGLTHEVYYRCLAKLARDGLIERTARRIRFLS